MFKKEEEVSTKDAETVIGPSIKVKGNFFGEGNIVVEGTLDGAIKTSSNLFIGPKAKVKANIEAKQARISGEVYGNLKIKGHLDISKSAKIFGDLEVGSISIETGAIFDGKCTMEIKKVSEKEEVAPSK